MTEPNIQPWSQSRVPVVSLLGLKKINTVLYPMAFTMHSLYGCTAREFLEKFGPIVTYIGALVYQANQEVEEAQRGEAQYHGTSQWDKRRHEIKLLFQELLIYDPVAEELLDEVGTYWELENKLNYNGIISKELLAQTIALRPSDLLAYHHICLHLANVPNRDEIFGVLIPWQIYMELLTDILEYPKDVATKDYNTYRMLVKLYGPSAKGHLAHVIADYRRQYEKRMSTIPVQLQLQLTGIFKCILTDIGGIPVIPEPILEF